MIQRAFLALASLAILSGWFFLLKYREPNSTWRTSVSLATSVCLTAYLPIFLFELSQTKWLMHQPLHHAFSMYVWIWVRWAYQGYLVLVLGVAGSFLGRGRARIAFVVGSILLLILRASMGTWVF
jgi:L-asparagine transporter-like permease